MVHLNLALDKSSFIEKFPSTSFNISQLPNSNLSSLSKVTFFSTLNLSSSQAKNFQFFGALGEVSNKYSVLHPKFWEFGTHYSENSVDFKAHFRLRTNFVNWQKSCVVACCSLGFRRMQILTKSFCVSGLKALVPASTAFHGIFFIFSAFLYSCIWCCGATHIFVGRPLNQWDHKHWHGIYGWLVLTIDIHAPLKIFSHTFKLQLRTKHPSSFGAE